MSFQPHKEWRFIIYVVPIFTLQAANGFANISIKWRLSVLHKLLILICIANVLIGVALSLMKGYISSFNYPGGDALVFVNSYVKEDRDGGVFIHMDTSSCISGISRFGELHNKSIVSYDKTEDEFDLLSIWNDIDILITEMNFKKMKTVHASSKLTYNPKNWKNIHVSEKFEGISIIPLFNLIQEQRVNSATIPALISQILNEFASGKFTTIQKLLHSIILRSDYLYVYKRLRPDEGLEELVEDSMEFALIEKESTEPFNNPKFDTIDEVNLNDVREEVNEDINIIEDYITS